jgi:hypothetical protein
MNKDRFFGLSLLAIFCFVLLSRPAARAQSLNERNEVLCEQLRKVHGLSEGQMDSIRAIFRESGVMGQGNPVITKHPMTPDG